MKSIKELFQASCDYLEKKGISQSKKEVEYLFMRGLKKGRLELYMDFEKPLSSEELAPIREMLKKRGEKTPIAYIEGSLEFLDCELEVSPDVLIPRPETELLAEKIVDELKGRDLKGKTLWDIGTGSGCLAISIKKRLDTLYSPKSSDHEGCGLRVIASDISSKALDIARSNAKKNKVEITFLEGDLFDVFSEKARNQEPLKSLLKEAKVDFIVSNPPYIGTTEPVCSQVKDQEPALALFAGIDGLDIYRRLASSLHQYVHAQGKVWLEIGYTQGESVKKLFTESSTTPDNYPYWENFLLEKDYAGWNRFFSLERAANNLYDECTLL